MSTDRELLEAAARAFWAGEIDDVVSIRWGDQDACILYIHGDNQDHNGHDREYRWNPLDENHDAFELAVKLDMNIFQAARSAYALPSDDDGTYEQQVRYSDADGDPYAATRRAIVCAAASMAPKEKAE